eukprot:m51a1_g641 putative adenylate cyclase protein (928) ;mRNA; r:169308-173222
MSTLGVPEAVSRKGSHPSTVRLLSSQTRRISFSGPPPQAKPPTPSPRSPHVPLHLASSTDGDLVDYLSDSPAAAAAAAPTSGDVAGMRPEELERFARRATVAPAPGSAPPPSPTSVQKTVPLVHQLVRDREGYVEKLKEEKARWAKREAGLEAEKRELKGRVRELQDASEEASSRETDSASALEVAAAEQESLRLRLEDEANAATMFRRKHAQAQEQLTAANTEIAALRRSLEAAEKSSGDSEARRAAVAQRSEAEAQMARKTEELAAENKRLQVTLEETQRKLEKMDVDKALLESSLITAGNQIAMLNEKLTAKEAEGQNDQSQDELDDPKKPKEIEPPKGNIALAFTDVENSTAQWEQYPDAMRTALEQHFQVLREHLAKCEGYEVKTEGDAMMAVFAAPQQAVRWCAQVQESLLAVEWSRTLLSSHFAGETRAADGSLVFRGLKVRMGIHYGPVHFQIDKTTGRADYYGITVNRAARIAGLAHGGQILASGTLWDIAKQEETSVISVEMGNFPLKSGQGIKAHERIIQIMPRGLKKRFLPTLRNQEAIQAEPESGLLRSASQMNLLTSVEEGESLPVEQLIPEIQGLDGIIREIQVKLPPDQQQKAQYLLTNVITFRQRAAQIAQTLMQLAKSRTEIGEQVAAKAGEICSLHRKVIGAEMRLEEFTEYSQKLEKGIDRVYKEQTELRRSIHILKNPEEFRSTATQTTKAVFPLARGEDTGTQCIFATINSHAKLKLLEEKLDKETVEHTQTLTTCDKLREKMHTLETKAERDQLRIQAAPTGDKRVLSLSVDSAPSVLSPLDPTKPSPRPLLAPTAKSPLAISADELPEPEATSPSPRPPAALPETRRRRASSAASSHESGFRPVQPIQISPVPMPTTCTPPRLPPFVQRPRIVATMLAHNQGARPRSADTGLSFLVTNTKTFS